ncbi:MAG: translation initiation factor IF-2 [Liquorilactobacillus nagelii]|jgi:translation initiation factor IF-2|uniref:Translation initiation factor IF-2 n=3 Tax=Liquorilactobacillus TaxID=2767888 RepID=A0A3Q8CMB6_9LACO|nr:translation initiation factor IF-2 [Liquorilactobacillus nagelii]AUJ32249.1 translation initiation factor IF-2 [Liquorilactobacillus nagelii]KRL40839.1 translation initiation factor IF-2 [Liquorilactobacillus nagelii DSM 13675]MCC7615424.1 translation initiation factor IF-2 [Liquorilactobacillus nagelii]MCI1699528.1 translation initiation factor IF-2 [Liquorilactobacillus nagelii]MCP9314706.1 translation initiation factor IF-2 [Liquorilactobacillus nagelii]
MGKKRIYQLAKELNISSKEVIAAAKERGFSVRNHMSTLGENEERQLRESLRPNQSTKTSKQQASVKKESSVKNKPVVHETSHTGKNVNVNANSTKSQQATDNSRNKRPETKQSQQHNNAKTDQGSNNRTTNNYQNNRSNQNRNNQHSYGQNRYNSNFNKKKRKNRRNNRRPENNKPAVPPRKNKPLPEKLIYTVGMNVAEIAKKIHREPAEIIKKLFMLGVMVNQNQSLDKETIEILANEYGIGAEEKVEVDIADIDKFFEEEKDNKKHLVSRPPVVTIMGHVDHGKTTLLDKLRHTHVTEGEAGGITQHIGAYQVKHDGKIITFLDTPGHAAFTNMRARGADITDITVLVVAADDGVMPQTIEAINHAKAAGVPIIVAINKIDKPGANPNHVMEELTEYGLISEAWGGSTIFVEISAKFGKNLDELLEMILLESEMLELRANPKQHGAGSVIEARLDKGKGAVATLLVQQGTLHVGDPIVVGNTFGRVRTMISDKGQQIKKALPATPVEITGLNEVPDSGDRFVVFSDEKSARAAGEERAKRALIKERNHTPHVTLDNLFDSLKEGELKEVNVIIKADVQGSVEALANSLQKINVEGVRVNIIHQAAGAINESDVTLAEASNAIIIGFNVRPTTQAKSQADTDDVDIRLHNVIYQAIDQVETAMKGMLEPVYQEKVIGQVEIRQTYKVSKLGTIGGGYVTDGYIQRDSGVRLIRDGIVIYEGKLASLKRFKDDAKEVKQGFECGLMIENYNDIKVGDQVEAFIMQEVPTK